jgi:dynamin 1-like protein
MEIELIRELLDSYFSIVRKTIADQVPKTIMHLIVNYAKDNLQNRLVSTLYKEDMFSDLLVEDAQMVRDREKWRQLLDVYRRASAVLQDLL